MTRWASRSNGI
jgi:UDP-glucose 4-epimerase